MNNPDSQNGRSAAKTGKSIAASRVIRFFLNLYRLQLGVSSTAANRGEARAIPLPPGPGGADAAYELCIKDDNQLKTRRMTIGLASGITGSKSTCFKVTFDELRAALENVLNTHGKALHSFRETIRAYVHNKQQGRKIKHLEGLITGLLDLLTRLNTAQVAIRDLKPENIFLVSQSEQSSAERAWEHDYRLGLIDFETAVNLNPEKSTALSQPMLAGTPYYSTPAHIFENTILKNLYPDNSFFKAARVR